MHNFFVRKRSAVNLQDKTSTFCFINKYNSQKDIVELKKQLRVHVYNAGLILDKHGY